MMFRKRLSDLATRLGSGGIPLLPIRLMIGFGFAAHGWAKLARGPASFATVLDAIGVPAPGPMAWLTTLFELVGGAALALGLWVVPLTLPLIVIMLTAMFGVHWQNGFSSVRLKAITPAGPQFGPTGYEINLLYIAGLVSLAMAGVRKNKKEG